MMNFEWEVVALLKTIGYLERENPLQFK